VIPNTPAIGIRFDIGKVDSIHYGLDCWKIFWRAVDPETIKGTLLFGGGTAATLSGREYAFCIAIQTTEESVLKAIKDAFSASEEFKKVCASPMFIEGASATAEPLPDAGRIDLNGNLVGEAYASRSALDIVWRERQPTAPATPQPTVTPERPRPAEKENDIAPDSLWAQTCTRRERLGIPTQEEAPETTKDVSGDEHDVSGPPVAGGPRVICPKCQAQNSPDRTTCSQCGAKLLPGRGILERIGYFAGGIVLVAAFVGLAWLFLQMEMAEALPPCCASPVPLVLMALSGLVGTLRLAFGRVPEYEKYVERARRHIEPVPEQALADFTKALELAPEKKQADILKQRGELYSKLGRKEEALADLSAYAVSPQAHKGAKLVSEIVGVEMEEAAGTFTKQTIEGLQTALVREGALKVVGYCKRCKDAVGLDEDHRCSNCGRRVKEPRFVKLQEREAELAKIREEAAALRRKRLIWLAVGGVVLFACALCVGMGMWSSRMREGQEEAKATAAVTAAPTTFADNIFSFEYPSNWDRMAEEDIDTLLQTSLKGLRPGSYDYIGGVYTGGVGECRGCAQIVIVVMKDPALTGTLTDEQYERVRETAEEQMGSRLISHRKIEVSSMPAAESVHIGKSRQTKIWELIIVPPEPGVAYLFSCSSHKDSYADLEPVFERAIESLRIGEDALEATATPGPTPEPTVDTSDCTLDAAFQADVTVPDNTQIEAGQPFTKTWRIRNTGTCEWGVGYRLTFADGDQMGGPGSVDVPETVAGESAEISVELIAPAEAGRYRGYWQMCVNQSECFGEKVYVQIVSFKATP
jgi:hypothetical protein